MASNSSSEDFPDVGYNYVPPPRVSDLPVTPVKPSKSKQTFLSEKERETFEEYGSKQTFLSEKERETFEGYDFPFENLVLEGGGAKLVGAVGTVKVLEELGILGKMKRFGGSSAGALLAAALALKYSATEIEKLMSIDLNGIIRDEYRFTKTAVYVKNLWRHYGAHCGATLETWLGDLVAGKMNGKPDATFWQLYEKTGNELAITVTELMQRECLYFHVKTTPHWPIREALFMSMSIPGFLRPTIIDEPSKNHLVTVDGGVTYNYPIHCFDGWYLSPGEDNDFMEKHIKLGEDDDSFWKELGRFTGRNNKTLGVMVYGKDSGKSLQDDLKKRNADYVAKKITEEKPLPDTKLKRERVGKKHAQEDKYSRYKAAHLRLVEAAAIMHGHRASTMIGGKQFDDDDATLLYGKDATAEEVKKSYVKRVDGGDSVVGGDSEKEFDKHMVEKATSGLIVLRQMQIDKKTYKPTRVDGIFDFVNAIVSFYGEHMARLNQRSEDYYRTIGVDVHYIDTLDFDMKEDDRKFLLQQSKVGCLAFLHEYIEENKPTKKVAKK